MPKWRTPEQRLADAEAKAARASKQIRTKSRSDDLRRKILLGSWLLSQINGNPAGNARLMAAFGQYLTRNIDRALFGLPPLPEPSQGDSGITPPTPPPKRL